MSTACIPVRRSSSRPARSSAAPLSLMRMPEHLLDLGFVGGAGRQPAIIEQTIAGIEQHRNRAATCATNHRPANDLRQRRRHESRSVVRQQHGIAIVERRRDLLLEHGAHRLVQRPPRLAIDPNNLLPCRVDAAGEDTGLDRRAVPARPHHVPAIDAAMKAAEQAAAFGIGADESDQPGAAAERRRRCWRRFRLRPPPLPSRRISKSGPAPHAIPGPPRRRRTRPR